MPEQNVAVTYGFSVTATTRIILIDKSNVTDYRHQSATRPLRVKRIDIHVDQLGAGSWNTKVGVVIENDVTDGSVDWIADVLTRAAVNKFIPLEFPANGLSLDVTGGVSRGVASGNQLANSTDYDNDDNMTDAVGNATVKVAPGDIVLEILENSGTTTLAGHVVVIYQN